MFRRYSTSGSKGNKAIFLFVIALLVFSSIPLVVSGEMTEEDIMIENIPDWLHEKLGTDPEDPKSPGVYVIYRSEYQTLDYNTWETYEDPNGTETIATDGVVIRRGTELKIGGHTEADAEIQPAVEGMTQLEIQEIQDGWNINIPEYSSVGPYTFTLTEGNWTEELDISVIYDPWDMDIPDDQRRAYAYDEESDRPEKDYIFTSGGILHEGALHPFGNDTYDRPDMYEFALRAVAGSEDTHRSAARLVRVVAQRSEAVPSEMQYQPLIRDASQILFGSGTTVMHGEEFEYTGLTLEDAEVLGKNGQTIEGIDGLTEDDKTKEINAWCDETSWAKTALLRSIGIPSRVASLHPTEDTDYMGHFMAETWFDDPLYETDWRDDQGQGGWYVLDGDEWNAEWYVTEPTFWMPAGEAFSSRSNYGRMTEVLFMSEYEIAGVYVPGTNQVTREEDLIDVTEHYIEDEDFKLDHGTLTKLKGRGVGDSFKVELENTSRLRLDSDPAVNASLYVSKEDYPAIPLVFEGYPFASPVESHYGDEVVLDKGAYYISIYAPKNGDPAVDGDFGEYTLTLEETPDLTPTFDEEDPEDEEDERRTADRSLQGYAIGSFLLFFWGFAYVLKKKTD